MDPILLRVASKIILPLLLMFSVFLLLRGHYLPGGGFVGGLVASIAFVLHSFANGLSETKKIQRISSRALMPLGLTISLVSAALPIFIGDSYLTVVWYPKALPVIGRFGTALFFDLGVYLVVVGATLTIIFGISEKN